MEAWIKFQAPGITLPLGLGIGQLVFNALNKVELGLSVVILLTLLASGIKELKWKHLFFVIPFIILALQSLWLLPALDARAELHIQGLGIPPSNLHFYYLSAEVLKVICLVIFGLKLFKP